MPLFILVNLGRYGNLGGDEKMKDLEAFMFGAYDESLLENAENISDKEMQAEEAFELLKEKLKEKEEAKQISVL